MTGSKIATPSIPHPGAPDPDAARVAAAWSRKHHVDIRLSVPFFGRRFYLTVVSGGEKRGNERRKQDRHHYPLRTAANIFFFVGSGAAFYAVALLFMAFATSIIEW